MAANGNSNNLNHVVTNNSYYVLIIVGIEADLPDALRIKIFMNPPDEHGNYPTERKRQWYVNTTEITDLTLRATIKLWQEYFQTRHHLKVYYHDGEELMDSINDRDLREACTYFKESFCRYENY